MADDDDDGPALVPEVLPPEGPRPADLLQGRLELARNLLWVDALNLVLRGPLAIKLGFPIGALVTFVVLRRLGWRGRRLATATVLGGLYVMTPDPGVLPMAAIAGLVSPLGGPPSRRGPV
ncbi:MAG: hypothetical protein IPK07_07630 [Deltaproteobacteria bacterium]|nr:hypothetical protein [Deltaproteobacteria bacterium]